MNTFLALLDAPAARNLAAALLHFLWQGALVVPALAATELPLARARPHWRYAAACAAAFDRL